MGAIALLLPVIMPLIQSIVGGVLQDKAKAAEISSQIQIALINNQTQVEMAIAEAAKSQAAINLAEAQSPSIFVSGWRPFLGWICGFSFLYSFAVQPTATWIVGLFGGHPLPVLDTASLTALTMGMLGLGAMRTAETIQGVASANMSSPRPGTIRSILR